MNIINLNEVNSTNSYVKEKIDQLPDKTVVLANRQTAGRGRFNRNWIDMGEGNLFMSVILKPFNAFNPIYSNLTQYMSVILCRVLGEYGLFANIKWPNDVLLDGKKIAGILSEAVVKGDNFKGLVLGVGVNVNADADKLKLVTDKVVTSLNIELSKEYVDKKLFTDKLLTAFFKDYDKFLNEGFKLIKDEYICKSNFVGNKLKVRLYNDTIEGVCVSVNDFGELILKLKHDTVAISAGDIL